VLTARLPPLDVTPDEAALLGYMPHRDDFERVCVFSIYSGPSSYDQPDIQTTWVTTKTLVLTYDQSLELRTECRSRPKRVSACAVVNKDLRCIHKRQSKPRYACLWT
jgi:hypothetical protein